MIPQNDDPAAAAWINTFSLGTAVLEMVVGVVTGVPEGSIPAPMKVNGLSTESTGVVMVPPGKMTVSPGCVWLGDVVSMSVSNWFTS